MEESEPGTTTSNPKDQYPECVNSGESAVFTTVWMKNCGICPDHSYSKLRGPASTLAIEEKL